MTDEKKPRLGVAVLVFDNARLLLGRRGKDPNRGKWVIPGGGIKFGEPWIDAARRELLEETGLHVDVSAPRPYVLEIMGPEEHRVILCFAGYMISGSLRAGSDLLEVRFFDQDELPADVSPAVRPALAAFGWDVLL